LRFIGLDVHKDFCVVAISDAYGIYTFAHRCPTAAAARAVRARGARSYAAASLPERRPGAPDWLGCARTAVRASVSAPTVDRGG